MNTVAALEAEIDARQKRISVLEEEIAGLRRAVSILAPPKEVSPAIPSLAGSSMSPELANVVKEAAARRAAADAAAQVATSPAGALLQAFAASMEAVQETSYAPKWQQAAQALLNDGGTHELKDLVTAAQAATVGIPAERVRKSLHVWLTRRTEKGELVKLERGEYRLARPAAATTPTKKETT